MSKILAAIEALANNATHPKFITEALSEIHDEFEALKERVKKLEPAPAPEASAPAPETPAPAAPVVPPVTA